MRRKEKYILLCILIAVISVCTGCGKEQVLPDIITGNGTIKHADNHTEENKEKIREAVNIKEKYVAQIVRILEQAEPGCKIISAEESGEMDGGYLVYVETESGGRYLVNTATYGEIGNITDEKTGKMIYPSEDIPEEEDDSFYVNASDINTALMMSKGMPKESAQAIAEVLIHAAANECISRIEGYDPDKQDIRIKVTMDTGKVFYITYTEESEWNVTISDQDFLD